MTDDMEEFSRLLKDNPPPTPDNFIENQAIEKAMAAFDKKNESASQGIAGWRRLMGAVRTVKPNDGGFMKKTYMVAGGLCAATLAIALLNTSALQQQFHRPVAVSNSVAKQDGTRVAQASLKVNEGGYASPMPAALQAPVAPEPQVLNAPPAEAEADSASRDTKKEAVANYAPAMAKDKAATPPLMASIAAAPQGRAMMDKVAGIDMVAGGAPGTIGMVNGATADMRTQAGYHDEGRDTFEHVKDNPLKLTAQEPVSTFSIDVDSSSYSFMRASLMNNALPQKDAVRIEEMVNYFPYDYAVPKDKSVPFASSVNVMPTPWNKGTKLIHIGIKGYALPQAAKPHANLVFLIDTSGSMNEPNKLPLLKNSLKLLLDSLSPEDSVAIVTYAGNAGVALEPTQVKEKGKILSVIDTFNAGGSTAGAEGIRQAYQLAERNFDKKGVNRVILATDGDFNVGITDQNELKSFIERERDSGVFLSVLGFGQGNYNDAMMQTLAQNGNGNAAYIDNLNEARKVLVDEASSTLFTIAKDVKIQVEFNPAKVAEYRLIGYETRMLKREDFNNDKVDAGDIGSGHTVTAIYEITPTDSDAKLVDDLRYGNAKPAAETKGKGNEYGFLKIRYKLPKEDTSKLITTPIDGHVEVSSIDKASTEARFATSVAAFGQLLRGDGYTKSYSYDDVLTLAESAKGADRFGYRAEFINLVRLAKSAANAVQPQPDTISQPMPVPQRID